MLIMEGNKVNELLKTAIQIFDMYDTTAVVCRRWKKTVMLWS